MAVTRFCQLVGMPRRTYYDRRAAAARAAGGAKPTQWPRPARERIADRALHWARTYPQWGIARSGR